jgi:hypothetical protein
MSHGKHERRNQEQIANFPSRQGVAHQEQIRRPVFANGGDHGGVCAVRDGLAEARFLAFELKPELYIHENQPGSAFNSFEAGRTVVHH